MRIPGTDLCLKRYRDDNEVGATVRREIARGRFERRLNTCAQEYDYFQSLKKMLPPEILSVFPEEIELWEDKKHGWCLVESLVLNGDGTIPEKFSRVYRSAAPSQQARLYADFCRIISVFEAAAVRFYDPQNVIVQWPGRPFEGNEFRLRIVDFEPASRTLLPLDSLAPAFCRMKLRRRVRRYAVEHLHKKYHPLPCRERLAWDDCIATAGGELGLSSCRAFLENKPVNDIFYEGIYRGRPCIVKCSSRAPESIVNEYELSSRMYAADPMTCAEPFAYWKSQDGRRAFVVVERLSGPSLMELRRGDESVLAARADGVAADFVRIADALESAGIVHRDMGTMDNYLMGSDGHFRLIDFQFAVDRAVGCRDPWLRRHPAYHFVVFSGMMGTHACTWNDMKYLVDHLRFRMPRTMAVDEAIARIEPRVSGNAFSIRYSLLDRFVLKAHRLSLWLQRLVHRDCGRKATSIERRLGRMKNI